MIQLGAVIEEIWGNGHYQIFLLLAILIALLASPLLITGSVFLAGTSGSRCFIEEIDNLSRFVNVTETQIQQQLFPWDSLKGYDTCQTYQYDFEDCKYNSTLTECTAMLQNMSNTNITLSTCRDGFIHDRSVFTSTIVTQWDLVCNRILLLTISNSTFFIGMMLGAIAGGVIADRFGRVFTIRLGTIGSFIFGCSTMFSPNIYVFTVLRSLTVMFYYPVVIASMVYGVEICTAKWRKYYGLAINGFFGLGCILLSIFAYFIRDWKYLQLCISCYVLVFLVVSFILPKSPRWLFSLGKKEESKQTCIKMAKRNQTSLSQETWDELLNLSQKEHEETKKFNTLKETFKLPCTRFLTLSNMFVWWVTSLVYFGLALNSGSLAGNQFLNNGLGGLLEFIACSFAIPVIWYFGCTKAATWSLVISSLACLSSTAVIQFQSTVSELNMLGVALAMIGRFGSSGSFGIIYFQTVELFPTCGRSTALGLAGVGARIGSTVAPFSIQLQYSIPWLTQTIFGVLAGFAALIVSVFPETQGKELTMTFDEAERNFRYHLQKTFLGCFFKENTRDQVDLTLTGEKKKSMSA